MLRYIWLIEIDNIIKFVIRIINNFLCNEICFLVIVMYVINFKKVVVFIV